MIMGNKEDNNNIMSNKRGLMVDLIEDHLVVGMIQILEEGHLVEVEIKVSAEGHQVVVKIEILVEDLLVEVKMKVLEDIQEIIIIIKETMMMVTMELIDKMGQNI